MMEDSLKLSPAAIERMATEAGDDPRKLAAVADLARLSGHGKQAYALGVRAREAPGASAATIAATVRSITHSVPQWHFQIVRDEVRNAAYDAALRRAITPGSLVLDIGSGTGLLAMMAARAGAARVISCELNPAVADAARDVVALNGLAKRVTVITTHSSALDIEELCGRRADVIVSEIVSNDLVGEGALDAMTDAIERLLVPGGRIIPLDGEIRVALADWQRAAGRSPGVASGFDISPFGRLRQWPQMIDANDRTLVLRSAPQTLLSVDLSGRPHGSPRSGMVEFAPAPDANGVAQWMRLRLDERTTYENDPAGGTWSCWAVLFHPFSAPLNPDKPVRVHGARRSEHIDIWAES